MEIVNILAMALALGVAIIGHEIMHGFVAKLFGDMTASMAGRLSINPLKHIDPVGTIIFPIFLYFSQKMMGVSSPIIFGWAKPVPVNMSIVIRNAGYLGGVAVSLAGVAYNLLLAIIASMFIGEHNIFINYFLYYTIAINIILMVFNLIPIPPLDGANALRYLGDFLGIKAIGNFYGKIERFGMVLLIIILFTPISNFIFGFANQIITHFYAH
jgi:Zn-dependent protease